MATASLPNLPGEVLLHIISFLEPVHITQLQRVSKAFLQLGRDHTFWRVRCFEESSFLEAINRRRDFDRFEFERNSFRDGRAIQAALRYRGLAPGDQASSASDRPDGASRQESHPMVDFRQRERVRIMANWDPSYPSERVSWYNEYIQRHASISISWLQQPRIYMSEHSEPELVEARGVALYRPDGPGEGSTGVETVFAVSPLDDGGVCIWDVGGTRGRKGAIISRSKPGILFIDGPGSDNNRRDKRVDSGVTECVSVDSQQHRAFFAVQSHLIDIDLRTLSVVGCESFPWSITALSAAHPAVPVTVGTNLGIHMHDYRSRANHKSDILDRVDTTNSLGRLGAKYYYERSLMSIFDTDPLPPYAPLSQPGPLHILHLQKPGSHVDLSDDIYIAGRFSNILHYDRRRFPSIKGSIHSGARLCSMASLPHPFSSLDHEIRRGGALSLEQVHASKTIPGGRTLIACGEYNTKGSLELYGFATPTTSLPDAGDTLGNSLLKNRHTSSSAKLLSVANHGTRIVVSDGAGYVKWFERDAFTEVRRCRIGHSEPYVPSSIFGSMPASDEIARKLLPTQPEGSSDRVGNDDLLFWTGEKLGLVGFSSRPGFTAEGFEERTPSTQDAQIAAAERVHREHMRRALKRQADDVRFVRHLGLG